MYHRGMKRYNIKVTGRVQGVFYRNTARQEAVRLGLNGLARNEPDGSVYIEAEGEESSLKEFLAWCHDGPQLASVTEVEISEAAPVGHKGFEIS